MKKFLLAVALFLVALLAKVLFSLIVSKQIFACDHYEDKNTIAEIIKTGMYHKNISGVVCHDNVAFIPVKNGKAEGLAKLHYASGALLSEANYKNGKKEGLDKTYYESGALEFEINFKNGKAEGSYKKYYESGVLAEEGNTKNDNMDGLAKIYYESGALRVELNYKDGKREGLNIAYLENGKKFAEILYSNDNPISGKCANGRELDSVELSNWTKGLKIYCD